MLQSAAPHHHQHRQDKQQQAAFDMGKLPLVISLTSADHSHPHHQKHDVPLIQAGEARSRPELFVRTHVIKLINLSPLNFFSDVLM